MTDKTPKPKYFKKLVNFFMLRQFYIRDNVIVKLKTKGRIKKKQALILKTRAHFITFTLSFFKCKTEHLSLKRCLP